MEPVSPVGRQAYAVGGNEHAAFQSGVDLKRTLFTMILLGSVLAAFVGVILTARISTGEANIGLQYPMQSIIACVIGGIALSVGEGRVSGAIMGALFIVLLSNGMDLIRVQSYVQDVLLGADLQPALFGQATLHLVQRDVVLVIHQALQELGLRFDAT